MKMGKQSMKISKILAAPLAIVTVVGFTAVASAYQDEKDIVDTAASAGDFTTLVAAVEAAGLVETLKGPGPYTVFAPNDEAFAKLPEGTVEELLEPENRETLVSILTYHVVAGEIMAADVVGQTATVETVQGASIEVNGAGDSVMVNNATVIATDIEASNGVIHVIDTVIMPPM